MAAAPPLRAGPLRVSADGREPWPRAHFAIAGDNASRQETHPREDPLAGPRTAQLRWPVPGVTQMHAVSPATPARSRSGGRLPRPVAIALLGLAGIAIAVVPVALLLARWDWLSSTRLIGRVYLLDLGDITVYFRESAWVVGPGRLFVTIRSEYPLLANLAFGAVRLASQPLVPVFGALKAYEVTWIVLAYWVLLTSISYSLRVTGRRVALLWLTPAVLYFSLLRFDLLPTMATLLALVEARDGRPHRSAAWLGIAIAFKGYALYALPAFLVWVVMRYGWRRAFGAAVLATAPMAVSLGIVYQLGGLTAMLMPFQIQATRPPNGQSTWDVIQIVTRLRVSEWLTAHAYVPTLLSLAGALAAAALRPRTFGQLVRAVTLGIAGFVTFSVFYSPQYVLWFVPMAALDDGIWMFASVVLLGWVTTVYYPVLFGQSKTAGWKLGAYQASVVVTTLVRTLVPAAALPARWREARAARPERPSALPDLSA